jgi:hypothetical protein
MTLNDAVVPGAANPDASRYPSVMFVVGVTAVMVKSHPAIWYMFTLL